MATVGTQALRSTVFSFFDALRSYDVEKACAALADDADWSSPWSKGTLTGKEAIKEFLTGFLGDPKTRPSLTISDVSGSGDITHLDLSVSGRFGQAPQRVRMSILCLKDTIHQVVVRPL